MLAPRARLAAGRLLTRLILTLLLLGLTDFVADPTPEDAAAMKRLVDPLVI
jgi:hypothetical protein